MKGDIHAHIKQASAKSGRGSLTAKGPTTSAVCHCACLLWLYQAALEAESRHQLESALKGTAAAASTLKEAKVRKGGGSD